MSHQTPSEIAEADVQPCPFCGATGDLIEVTPWHGGGPNKHMVSCINHHGCEVLPGVTGETRSLAIAAWNRRAPPEVLSAAKEQPEPVAWLCEFIRADDTVDREVVLEDPETTRWADSADGDGVSPYRVTPLVAAPQSETPKQPDSVHVASPVPSGGTTAALDAARLDWLETQRLNSIKQGFKWDTWLYDALQSDLNIRQQLDVHIAAKGQQ